MLDTTTDSIDEFKALAVPYSFGCVSKRSIPSRLCEDHDQRRDLLNGEGPYAKMRVDPKFTEAEIYSYLRLGVSTQSAVAFKALGYETPESLTEAPEVSALLPDHLARADREYPLEYIDQCEKEGILASACQLALRRGITTSHLGGVLNIYQLTALFLRNVQREGIAITGHQKNIIDYFVDGTIPCELQDESPIAPEKIVNVTRTFLKEDPEYFDVLRNDLPLFRKFLKANLGNKNSVIHLRDLVQDFGPDVLDLYNPLMPTASVYKEDGSTIRLGHEVASYIEQIATKAHGSYSLYRVGIKKSVLRLPNDNNYAAIDFVNMFNAGVEVHDVCKYVLEEGISPSALITARQDEIQQPLMSGAL